MGAITDIIKNLKPKIDMISKISNNIDTITLQNKIEDEVYTHFSALRPLSDKLVNICNIDDIRVLCIREFIQVRNIWATRSHFIRTSETFEYIRKFGRKIAEKVRNQIKDDFAKLVELAEKIKPYNDIHLERDVRKKINSYDLYRHVEICEFNVEKIILKTNEPYLIRCLCSNNKIHTFSISSNRSITEIEDLIDELIEIYEDAQNAVNKIHEYNKRILCEMEQISSPYMVSNSLKA